MATNQLYQESIDFISNNINVSTAKVPRQLLEYWHTPEDVTDYSERLVSLTSFLIFQYAFEIYCKTLGKEKQLSLLDTLAMFGQFQLLISIALGKQKDVTCNPVNLFDFDNYSSLNINIL
jgi:hypothetical protein